MDNDMGLPMGIMDLLERISKIIPSSSEKSYNCELCKDLEFVPETDENGITRYRPCPCVLANRSKRIIEKSGLSGAIDRCTFDSFKTETSVQETIKKTAMEYVSSLIESWKSQRRPWFYIGGNPGAGKTHICTAICGDLLRKNIQVKYMQWLNEVGKLKYINDDYFDEIADEYLNVPVLYIDDLLKQKYTRAPEFTEADIKVAFKLLNGRYNRNNPTIISSEWDLCDDLIEADEAVFSRVYECCNGFVLSIERKQENNYRLMR